MRSRTVLLLASTLLASACATTSDPGWTGHGATPFGEAENRCRSAAAAEDAAGNVTFEACMREQGWTR